MVRNVELSNCDVTVVHGEAPAPLNVRRIAALAFLAASGTTERSARSDASGARTLLGELRRIQPARSEAIRLLAALGGEPPAVEPAAR